MKPGYDLAPVATIEDLHQHLDVVLQLEHQLMPGVLLLDLFLLKQQNLWFSCLGLQLLSKIKIILYFDEHMS
jgi:hypothetical protein